MSTNPCSVTGILFVSHNLPDIGEVQWYAHGNRQEQPLVGEIPHDLLNHWPVLVLLADFAERKYIPRKKNTCKYLTYLFHDGTHGRFSNTKQFSNSFVAIGVSKPTQSDWKATNCNGFKKVRQCSASQYGVIAQLTDIQTKRTGTCFYSKVDINLKGIGIVAASATIKMQMALEIWGESIGTVASWQGLPDFPRIFSFLFSMFFKTNAQYLRHFLFTAVPFFSELIGSQ